MSDPPVTALSESLDLLLERVRLLFRRYLLALRPSAFKGHDADEVRDKVLHFLAQPDLSEDRLRVVADLDRALSDVSRWDLGPRVSSPDQPLARLLDLETSLALNDVERDVLWVLLAPELMPRYLWMYRALTGVAEQSAWPESLVQAAVDPNGTRLAEVRAALSAEHRLGRFGLVEEAGSAMQRADVGRFLRVGHGVVDYVLGNYDRTALPDHVTRLRPQPSEDGMGSFTADVQKGVRKAFRKSRRLLLVGVANCGGRQLAENLQADLGESLVVVRAQHLLRDTAGLSAAETLATVMRETLLLRAGLLVDELEVLGTEQVEDWQIERLLTELDRVRTVLYLHASPVLDPRLRMRLCDRLGAELIVLPPPDPALREARWARLLEGQPLARPAEALVKQARVYPIGVDDVPRAVKLAMVHARERSAASPSIDLADVEKACTGLTSPKLRELAVRERVLVDWADVVFAPEVLESIEDLLNYGRFSQRVLHDWGLARKVAYGTGLSALLSGPSGTGKTMVSGLIARELGKELYRIDLSRVVSKYIGETEQHLAALFEEAKAGDIALLFDEADSLFASRTEVQSSVDRYANLETNFLLQKIEEYDGVILLTTNFPKSIDDAFMRRLKFKIHFPAPDAELRARLWRSMIPQKAPLQEGLAFDRLGEMFELTGGQIRNAVFRAALYAVRQDSSISFELLERAALVEYREEGRLVLSGGPRRPPQNTGPGSS